MILLFQRTCQQQPTGMLVPALMAGSMIQRTFTGQQGNSPLPKSNQAHHLKVVEPYKLDPKLTCIRGHRSIVSDLDWVCEESWIPAFSQVGLAVKVKVQELLSSVHLLCRRSAWHALLWLAQVRSSNKTVINPLFSATTTAGYQRFSPPT